MKHTTILFFLFVSLISHHSDAQLRHIKGIQSIETSYLRSYYGNAFSLGYVRYYSNSFYMKATTNYESLSNQKYNVNIARYFFDLLAQATFADINEQLFFNLAFGGTVSYETVTNTEVIQPKNAGKFGIVFGLEAEYFLHDKIVWIIQSNYRFMSRTEFGNTRYYLGTGIRYNL